MRQAVGKTSELALLFGGSIAALVGMAANYGMRRRDLHDLYPALWAAAGEEAREKATKRWEQRMRSRDRQKTDVLSREAWIACKIIVDGWRRHNPASVEAWSELEGVMRDAMRDPGVPHRALGRIDYLAKSGFLWCRLPSGRCIAYASPRLKDQVWAKLRLDDGSWSEAEVVEKEEAQRLETRGLAQTQGATTPKVTALGVDSTTQKMARYALYGGLSMENLCLGIEREILVNGMRKCEAAGYTITIHNYDEAVAEVPQGFGSVEEMERLMLDLPHWTKGLPLTAHGFRAKRYAKR
jgi:DNA polymerase